ncbi:MAG: gfo/Idh/MocA family oxidoreductase, partial [Verrucomicrobiota bacterium]
YGNGVEMIHGDYKGRRGCHFIGSEGYLFVDRKSLESDPVSILETPLDNSDWHLSDIGTNHQRNWIDCIRSGDAPVADVEIGHRTNTVCLLANIGYWLGRDLEWDPTMERFERDEEANALLHHDDREPWRGIIQAIG